MVLRTATLSLFLFLPLLLGGCTGTNHVDSYGFGGSDQLTVELENARDRAKVALGHLIVQPGAPALCQTSFCGQGNTFLCSTLGALASQPDERIYLDSTLLTAPAIAQQYGALQAADFEITSDPQKVTVNGQVQDALTVGTKVTFYRPRVESKSADEQVALWLHEVTHSLGYLDTGTFGPFPLTRNAIDARAACETAALRAYEGAAPQSGMSDPPATLFADDFLVGPSLSSSWSITEGANGIQVGGGVLRSVIDQNFVAAVNVGTQTNVRVRTFVQLDPTAGSYFHLFSRVTASQDFYVAELHATGNGGVLALIHVGPGMWDVLATAIAPSLSGEMILDIKDTTVKGYYRGVLFGQATTVTPISGQYGFGALRAQLSAFRAETN